MSTTLLNLTDEIVKLDNLLAMATDVDAPEIQEAITRLLDLTEHRSDKVNAYAGLITELKLRAAARQAEASRLIDRARVSENMAAKLSERLHFAMKTMDLTKIETPLYTVSRVKNGGKAPLEIDGEVPAEYQEREVVIKTNKDKIRADLEAGKALAFARLGERGERLSIK